MNYPKFFLIIIFYVFVCFESTGQQNTNYLEIRSSLVKTTCGQNHIDSIMLTHNNLSSLDTTVITKGKDAYYYDCAMSYFDMYLYYDNESYMQHTVKNLYHCLYFNKKHSNAHINLSIYYYVSKEIDLAKYHIKKYKKYTPKKYWDTEQINSIEKL